MEGVPGPSYNGVGCGLDVTDTATIHGKSGYQKTGAGRWHLGGGLKSFFWDWLNSHGKVLPLG